MSQNGKQDEKGELYQAVLQVLQERRTSPSETIKALGLAMLLVLQASQDYFNDPERVKKTAEETFTAILREL